MGKARIDFSEYKLEDFITSHVQDYTSFYTEGYGKHLCDCSGIIHLNEGDRFVDEDGNIYKVVFKLFNTSKSIMVYHGSLIASNIN